MKIRVRPNGINPTSFEIEKAYQEIKSEEEVTIANVLLLDRIRVGIVEGEIPYGNSSLSIYNDKGFKIESKILPNGKFENWDTSATFPLDLWEEYLTRILDPDRDSPKICANCEFYGDEVCVNDKSEKLATFVAEFEYCELFSDLYEAQK